MLHFFFFFIVTEVFFGWIASQNKYYITRHLTLEMDVAIWLSSGQKNVSTEVVGIWGETSLMDSLLMLFSTFLSITTSC